jgi:hypothetical protein
MNFHVQDLLHHVPAAYQTHGSAMVMLTARTEVMSLTHVRLEHVVPAISDATIPSVFRRAGLAVLIFSETMKLSY